MIKAVASLTENRSGHAWSCIIYITGDGGSEGRRGYHT